MSERIECPTKLKVSARVLVFHEGKDPERDEPDEILEMEDRIIEQGEVKWE
jgi:hypothetical protein